MVEIGAIILAQETATTYAVQRFMALTETFRQVGATRLVLVTPREKNAVLARHAAKLGVICLDAHGDGAQTIDLLRPGLAYLQDKKCRTFLVAPLETPFFKASTVCALRACGAPLAMPCHAGRTGYPLLLDAALVPAALAYTGAEPEDFLRENNESCLVPVEDSGILRDTETAEIPAASRAALRPGLKLRLVREEAFFGPGPAQLLELIDETESVRLACQQVGISYSKGWKMLLLAEEQMAQKLVERQQGGKHGGSACLTEEGRALVVKYRLFEQRCRTMMQAAFVDIFGAK